MEKENLPGPAKMSLAKKHKHFDIPLRVNGSTRHIKGVTKHTTCGDVIKMVLRKSPSIGQQGSGKTDSYAIFESSRGIERILPGKSRLVKVMRSWGADSNFDFVFRKVNPIVTVPKISEAKRRRLTQRLRTLNGNDASSGDARANKYADPATMVGTAHSHNSRLNKYESVKNSEFVKELYFKDSADTMDEFISCMDQRNMNFCGTVTHNDTTKLSASTASLHREIPGSSDRSYMVNSHHVSMNNVNNVKYAVRKTLKSKTLSTSSINASNNASTMSGRPMKHKFIDSSPCREPVHSTPSNKIAKMETRLSKRHEQLACDITTKVARMNQRAGKDALLRKYFADYLTYNSPARTTRSASSTSSSSLRTRGDGAEAGYQSPYCRRGDGAEDDGPQPTPQRPSCSRPVDEDVADFSADSSDDSGQEEEISNFDIAFIDANVNIDLPACEPTCVGKLVDYSLSEAEASFLSDAGTSYSDEPSIISKASDHDVISNASDDISNTSDVISNASDVSSVSDIVKNIFSDSPGEDEDDLMESFMKTKHSEDFASDEGLSSMGSDDEKEIIV